MSDSDDGPGRREVAQRVFAAEYDDATRSYKEGEEERAPSYVVTPSGAKANRLFFVGVLTEVERVNEEMLRARVVDPTGAFVVYAGQYQPDERAFFERTQPPEFVAVTGKARTFQPEDSDRVFSSVRPETVNAVDADARDRWVIGAAERTLERVGTAARALRAGADGDPGAAGLDPTSGIALALEHYDTSPAYLAALRDLALDAVEVVAGERDEVRPLTADPDEAGDADLDELAALADEDDLATDAIDAESAAEAADAEPAEAAVDAGETAGDDGTADAQAEAQDSVDATADVGDSVDATAEAEAETETSADEGDDSVGLEVDDIGDFAAADIGAGTEDEAVAEDTVDEAAAEDTVDEAAAHGADGDEAGNGAESEAEAAPTTDEMYELDEEERREVEAEFGTEFETGTEVDEPGEAGIETPDSGESADAELEEPAAETGETEADEGEQEPESEPDATEEPPEPEVDEVSTADEAAEPEADEATEPGADETAGAEPAGDVDLDDAVMDHMRELDQGTGADRAALIESVADATGADRDAIEDAIQDALMGGQCYEPDDETLKPI